jgi:hypothetical protein
MLKFLRTLMIPNALKVTFERTKMLKEEKNVLFDDVTECRAFAVLVVSANNRNPHFFVVQKKSQEKKLSLTNVPIICLGLGFKEDNDTKIELKKEKN